MWGWLKWFWYDTVFSKVIAGLILTAILSIIGERRGWFAKLRKPPLRLIDAYPTEHPGATFPIKYYVDVINDSRKSVAVRVAGYERDTVSLQKFIPNTLQVMLGGKFLPDTNSVESVAVLPNQRCCAWVGVDSQFTKAQLGNLKGRIGTLTLTANGKRIAFKL
jgi:hypothetical protein